MDKEQIAAELTKAIAPAIMEKIDTDDTVACQCCTVMDYYHYFLKLLDKED